MNWPIDIHKDLVENYKVNSAATMAMMDQISKLRGNCALEVDYDGWRCSASGMETTLAETAHEAVNSMYEAVKVTRNEND